MSNGPEKLRNFKWRVTAAAYLDKKHSRYSQFIES